MSERTDENGLIIAKNITNLGLPVKFKRSIDGALGDTYFLEITNIALYTKAKLNAIQEQLTVAHGITCVFENTNEPSIIKLSMIYKQGTLNIDYVESLGYPKGSFPIGVDNDNKPVCIDFRKTPHLLIAGTTGSGKSTLLHNLTYNIIHQYHRTRNMERMGNVAIGIIDPKGSEFCDYNGIKCVKYVSDIKQSISLLKFLCDLMDKRYLDKSLDDYDIYLVIDELADLMFRSKHEVEESLIRLAQKGRACHIYLIVATQRPTVDVCSGLIKANMSCRIVLQTANAMDSVVVLEHKGAETLRGMGEAIIKNGAVERRFQVALPDFEQELIIQAKQH